MRNQFQQNKLLLPILSVYGHGTTKLDYYD